MDINHPDAPDVVEVTYRDLPQARMRARTVGRPVPGVPEVVLVQRCRTTSCPRSRLADAAHRLRPVLEFAAGFLDADPSVRFEPA